MIDPVEKHLFLEGVLLKYGYDFRSYSEASLNRRLIAVMTAHSMDLMGLLRESLASSEFFHRVILQLTVNTTEFFRDPLFFKSLRTHVLPVLKTYPNIKVWSAGCSTGEEPLSLAILMKEEGLLDRTMIYSTDISAQVVRKAQEGVYSLDSIKLFTQNYAKAGGIASPTDYYTSQYGLVKFNSDLREKIFYTQHSLVNDSVFLECHLVVCRNVLIYFNRELQNKVLKLLTDSLIYRGFLAIGSKESLRSFNSAAEIEAVDKSHNIYRLPRSRSQAVPGIA